MRLHNNYLNVSIIEIEYIQFEWNVVKLIV